MDLRDSPEQAEFRARVRSWLAATLPADYDPDDYEWRLPAQERFARNLAWHRAVYAGGWAGLHWPREYGGRGASFAEQLIFAEEAARVRAPRGVNLIGIAIVGPTLMVAGSEEQRRRFLRPMLSGDEIWCQGFSEPGAGSDLAAVRTRVEDRGDHWRVDGQKVWTSFARHARWCFLLGRQHGAPTGPARHKGLTMLCVDLTAPGVEVRPLVQINGDAEFNEVFFSDVRVAKEHVVGAPGEGWRVAVTTLMFERYGLGLDLRRGWALDQLRDLARRQGRLEDPRVRDRLVELRATFEAARLTAARHLLRLSGGEAPGPEGSLAKLLSSELDLAIAALAQDLLGPAAAIDPASPDAPDGGRWARLALSARLLTIAGGTSEIQRNIIAERVLGLPRAT